MQAEQTKKAERKVIFVRAEVELVTALDERLQRERQRQPGQMMSRSDLARRFLYEGLERE